jgi:CSLREA domain-containing protein
MLASLLVLAPRPAYAAGIIVNTNTDTSMNDGFCSLREAITAANTNTSLPRLRGRPGADVISFAADYTITLAGQLPVVNTVITINGRGMAKTIIQANACRTQPPIASSRSRHPAR